jgi:hypothetical protein
MSVNDAMRGTDPRMGLSRADVELGNRRGGEMLLAPISTLVDEAARQGVAPESALGRGALGAGAFVADLVNPTAWTAGAPIDKAIDLGVSGVQAYRALGPEQRALYNSMVRGLYHGSRDTGANIAKPFDVINRPIENWRENWFGGDMFGGTGRNIFDPKGRQLAEGYTESAKRLSGMSPGATAEGFPITRGAKFRLTEPIENVAQRQILDLTEGTLDQVDPALYQRLVDMYPDTLDALSSEDLAKMMLSGPGLHQSRFSTAVRPVLEDFGYDTIKHLSGQLQGDIVTPVYAFLNSAGLRATPTLPSIGRVGDVVDTNLSSLAQRGAAATGRAGAAIREGGASALDSLAAALQRPDMSSLPAPIRNFVSDRTMVRGSGEGIQDVRQFARNPQIDALLKRLGIDKLFSENVNNSGLPRAAFDDL